MDKVTTKIRFVAIPLFLLLLFTADSIIFSPNQVLSLYSSTKSYPFLAAEYGDKHASFELYQKSNNLYWLEQSAKQAHPESAFLWSFHTDNQLDAKEWLRHAVRLNHGPAALHLLQSLVFDKRWQEAQIFLLEHQSLFATLNSKQQVELKQLSDVIALAQLDSKILQNNFNDWHNWLLQQTLDVNALLNKFKNIEHSANSNVKEATRLHPQNKKHCEMIIQPLIERENYASKVMDFEQALKHSYLNDLPICFRPPQFVNELAAYCQADSALRANCRVDGLMTLPDVYKRLDDFTHLLVVTDRGEANVRGGIMFLDQDDSEQVFIHELTHWLGLVDEYPLSLSQQKTLCDANSITQLGHNVIVAPSSLAQSEIEQFTGRKLFKAKTCQQINEVQAYKWSSSVSVMEYLDTPLSKEYAALISDNIKWHQTPVAALNFVNEYTAMINSDLTSEILAPNGIKRHFYRHNNRNGNHNDKRQISESLVLKTMLFKAAQRGNANAFLRLSELKRFNPEVSVQLLLIAAKLGNEHTQLELAHRYLEGKILEGNTIEENQSKSAFWYRQAASQNNDFGLYFYGKCYELGWGCERSMSQATQLYKKSAMLGNSLAKKKLQSLSR